ncbi:MAG: thiamine/thiamine pyrophosphate ABC transporter permease ThiP [Bosea sp. (in: a-proteobacteria)]
MTGGQSLPHPGLIAAGLLAALITAALAGLSSAGGGFSFSLSPYLWGVVRGAAVQAALSTMLSLLFGTALALALARRTVFRGRKLLMALITAATVAPTIVIIFGVVAIYGRSGPLNGFFAMLGLSSLPAIYGLHGIVLAHVVMNAPLVTRVMLAALAGTPAEQTRLAAMLRFSAADCFRHLDAPVIRREWPGLAAFIFLLCFTSFAVVLSLGGGPANATLEVAIYQALRLEVDFARAAAIAMVQIALCLGFVLCFSLLGARLPDAPGQIAARPRPDVAQAGLRFWDAIVITLVTLLVAPVILSVLGGLPQLASLLRADVAKAALTSAMLATIAAILAVSLALLLASAAEAAPMGRASAGRARAIDLAVLALIGLPPFALVTGLFVLMRGSATLGLAGLLLVPLINALMALPFVYRLLAPPLRQSAARHGRLGASLGITGLAHLRIVAWPVLKRPLAAALALSAALSMGDFGVITLFGGGDLITLPYLMSERMGSYRLDEAGAIALLLIGIATLLAYIADKA